MNLGALRGEEWGKKSPSHIYPSFLYNLNSPQKAGVSLVRLKSSTFTHYIILLGPRSCRRSQPKFYKKLVAHVPQLHPHTTSSGSQGTLLPGADP